MNKRITNKFTITSVDLDSKTNKSFIKRNKCSLSDIKSLDLNIIGLMCIPPFNEDSLKYFKEMKILTEKL